MDMQRDKAQVEDRSNQLLGTIGFALLLSWVCGVVFCPCSSPLELNEAAVLIMLRALAFACTAVTLLATWLNPSWFAYKNRLYSLSVAGIVAQLPLSTMCVFNSFGMYAPLWASFVCWALFGVSCACFTLSWSNFYSQVEPAVADSSASCAVVAAAFVLLATSSMSSSVGCIVLFFFPLLSMAVLLHVRKGLSELNFPNSEISGQRFSFAASPSLPAVAVGIALGFVSGVLFSFDWPVPELLILFAGLLVFVMVKVKPDSIDIHSYVRLILPVTVFCLVSTLLLEEKSGPFAQVILSFGFVVLLSFDIADWICLARFSSRCLLSPSFVFGRGRASLPLGQAIGWALAALAVSSGVFDTQLFGVASLVVLVVFSSVITMIPEFPRMHDELAVDEIDSGAKDDECVSNESISKVSNWEQRCRSVADKYGLSPRETEVFFLLAKGRNAEYIEKELYITYHTVKTHIYHIYKKMGIGSRQELLDAVDNFKR